MRVLFWGVANLETAEVTDFFLSREEAEQALREIVSDEPYFATTLALVQVDFSPEARLTYV